MRMQGFRYWPESDPGSSGPQFPYALDSVQVARRYGFEPAPPTRPDQNARYLSSLTADRQDAYSLALYGPGPSGPGWLVPLPQGGQLGQSKDGCQTKAETDLYRSFFSWYRAETITEDLPFLWAARVFADPRYRKGLGSWSRCMRSRGYPAASPAAASTRYASATAGKPSRKEIRAAVADARCAQVTRLNVVSRALADFYGGLVRAQYRTEVTSFEQLNLAALPRAAYIVRSAQHDLAADLPAHNKP